MPAIQLSKAWSINPNVRNAYVSLTDMAGWWIFQNHSYLITKGWSVKFTCNGATGPSGPADTTDRLLSKANATTRGASAAAAQSYTVLQNSDGVQLMITYQGASDDVIRLSYSPGGLFTLATPSTNQPTATDEVVWCQGNSVVNATTSLDRVMTIWASDDGKSWCNALWRNNTLQTVLGFERITNYCEPGVFSVPYFAYRYGVAAGNIARRDTLGSGLGPVYGIAATAAGAAGWFGGLARVVTLGTARLTRLGGGTVLLSSNAGTVAQIENTFLSNAPALQNGTMPMLPLFLCGEGYANFDGIIGSPIDWWVGYSSSIDIPTLNDFVPGFDVADNPNTDPERTNWFIAIGSTMIRPWKNVAASIQTA